MDKIFWTYRMTNGSSPLATSVSMILYLLNRFRKHLRAIDIWVECSKMKIILNHDKQDWRQKFSTFLCSKSLYKNLLLGHTVASSSGLLKASLWVPPDRGHDSYAMMTYLLKLTLLPCIFFVFLWYLNLSILC